MKYTKCDNCGKVFTPEMQGTLFVKTGFSGSQPRASKDPQEVDMCSATCSLAWIAEWEASRG